MRRPGATRQKQAAWCGRGAAVRLAVGLVLAGAAGLASAGPPPAAPEYAVKAAFVYNFAKFVEWPKRATAAVAPELRICVLGADPFGGVLDETVAGKTIGERTMAVARVERVSETAGCAVVYVSASEAPRLRSVLAAFRGRPVLTVGDTDGFAAAGGIIGLFLEDNRVRFEINVEAADEAHLSISSRLLSLGRLVNAPGAMGH